MSDDGLRALERRWAASGAAADEAALIAARARTGLVPRSRLELAALLGHAGAREVCASADAPPALREGRLRGEDLWEVESAWAELLLAQDGPTLDRLLLAAARASMPTLERHLPEDAVPRAALAAAASAAACPCAGHAACPCVGHRKAAAASGLSMESAGPPWNRLPAGHPAFRPTSRLNEAWRCMGRALVDLGPGRSVLTVHRMRWLLDELRLLLGSGRRGHERTLATFRALLPWLLGHGDPFAPA